MHPHQVKSLVSKPGIKISAVVTSYNKISSVQPPCPTSLSFSANPPLSFLFNSEKKKSAFFLFLCSGSVCLVRAASAKPREEAQAEQADLFFSSQYLNVGVGGEGRGGAHVPRRRPQVAAWHSGREGGSRQATERRQRKKERSLNCSLSKEAPSQVPPLALSH